MKQFDYYEFSGILVPGAVTLIGLYTLFKSCSIFQIPTTDTWAVFLIGISIAYALGHLQQELASKILLRKKHNLSKDQQEKLRKQLLLLGNYSEEELKLDFSVDKDIFRDIVTLVYLAGKTSRFEIFNAVQGAARGLTISAALLGLGVIFRILQAPVTPSYHILIFVLFQICFVLFKSRADRYTDKLCEQMLSEVIHLKESSSLQIHNTHKS